MEARKEEASPVELSALLMDAVCTPAEREQTALGELAGHLGMERNILQSELMFLRAFAVDFAIALTLGQSPEQQAVLARINSHWERLDREVGADLLEDLQDRLALYGEAGGSELSDSTGLSGLVGRVFAQCVPGKHQGEDLSLLGGSMFAAFFAEIVNLFEEVEIVLIPGEDEEEGFAAN